MARFHRLRHGTTLEEGNEFSASAAMTTNEELRPADAAPDPELEAEIAKCGGDVMKAVTRRQRRKEKQLQKAAVQRAREGENNWEALSDRLGQNALPGLLQLVWEYLAPDQRILGIGDAWTGPDHSPELLLHPRDWLAMFREVGYHVDDGPAQPPERITLFRGGIRMTGMAWSAQRERAEYFQHRYDHRGGKPGKLWTVTVGPDRLLAHYHEKHRGEDEYVIDPTGLTAKDIHEIRTN